LYEIKTTARSRTPIAKEKNRAELFETSLKGKKIKIDLDKKQIKTGAATQKAMEGISRVQKAYDNKFFKP
jgi:3-isopropylmalate dehydratase small subunit